MTALDRARQYAKANAAAARVTLAIIDERAASTPVDVLLTIPLDQITGYEPGGLCELVARAELEKQS